MFNIYATDYAPVDPITPPCDITPIFIGYKGENKARCLIFDLTECVETFGDGGFVISFIRQGDDLPYLVTDTDRLDNNAIWIITDTDTAVDGYGMVQLQYIVDDVVCKSALYRTVTFDSNSITGDVPDPYEDLLAQIAAYAAQAEGAATTATAAAQTATTAVEEGVKTERSQRIAADEGLNTRINELMGLAGAPSMANSAAAMTDSSKIYVYTGNEAGYLTGHWYYYNGTEWADGGVYQATAVDTDKTLTVENMAADAAVVGDRIDECMAAFVINSASGSIASFADGADGVPLKDLVVNITPKQAGTGDPSPTNVRPITGWDSVTISHSGLNLYDRSVAQYNVPVYAMDGTSASYPDVSVVWIRVKPSTTYTYWLQPNSKQFYIRRIECDANKGFIRRLATDASSSDAVNSGTFTTTANTQWIQLAANQWETQNISLNNWEFMLCEGTATEYHPYVGGTYNISLSAAGTIYGGTLDVTTGMLTVMWAKMAVPSSGDIYVRSGVTLYRFSVADLKASGNTLNYIMSHFAKQSETHPNAMPENYKSSNVYWNNSNIELRNDSLTTLADWQAYINAQSANGTPLEICYKLAQPISYQLTPTEVKTLLANNNIWSDTGSVASCEYRADTKLYLEKLTNPDDDMVANANITSGSYFMVGNNLYLATANIANGGAITPGTNCTATNLAAALNAINS